MPIAPDLLARLPLAPLLAAQAVMVRRRALILPEPPGPRSGETGAGPALRLLIAGDSSAAGVGATTQSEALSGRLVAELSRRFRVRWRLAARTGATTGAALDSLSRLRPETFDVAIVALGVNDVTRLLGRRQWVARQHALHDLLAHRFGVGCIIASGLPPMGRFPLLPQPLRWVLGCHAARLDTALVHMAEHRPGMCHVPMDMPFEARFVARDGFHPSPAAYAQWASVLAGRVKG
ncbi:MAG: SGNH/GDSL hydrolase family protein [Jhaorihella sp.]